MTNESANHTTGDIGAATRNRPDAPKMMAELAPIDNVRCENMPSVDSRPNKGSWIKSSTRSTNMTTPSMANERLYVSEKYFGACK